MITDRLPELKGPGKGVPVSQVWLTDEEIIAFKQLLSEKVSCITIGKNLPKLEWAPHECLICHLWIETEDLEHVDCKEAK